jgi:hypothetical protein
MKFLFVAALGAIAAGGPVPLPLPPLTGEAVVVEKRATGIYANDFTLSGCRDIIFVFARGSTEIGNMVSPCLVLPYSASARWM